MTLRLYALINHTSQIFTHPFPFDLLSPLAAIIQDNQAKEIHILREIVHRIVLFCVH